MFGMLCVQGVVVVKQLDLADLAVFKPGQLHDLYSYMFLVFVMFGMLCSGCRIGEAVDLPHLASAQPC